VASPSSAEMPTEIRLFLGHSLPGFPSQAFRVRALTFLGIATGMFLGLRTMSHYNWLRSTFSERDPHFTPRKELTLARRLRKASQVSYHTV
jgi:hypothetical protein